MANYENAIQNFREHMSHTQLTLTTFLFIYFNEESQMRFSRGEDMALEFWGLSFLRESLL